MGLDDGDVGTVELRKGMRQRVRDWMVTGAALVIPILVTVVVLAAIVNFVSKTMDPMVNVLATSLGFVKADTQVDRAFVKVAAIVVVFGATLVVGVVANTEPTNGRFADVFHEGMERIPAVGSIYSGFRQMSEVVVESDVDSFQDVKLVEFPTKGSYTIAFVTADTPSNVEQAAGHPDMVTLFMPMAPNPVMGGYVLHVDRSRVVDIDMTVEEGVQSIVTSGVTVNGDQSARELSPERLRSMGLSAGNSGLVGHDGDADATDQVPQQDPGERAE
ncbi:DUF502 domain-containing protein [Halomarina litorea]|uniref:DUF502 domain-containing protein n=1 Tax=Halomarina litorea TaxID=2961595 RepID=UPI0020C56804|nr:DUF502 domain-containing protein [Halomarina sp. BCD28]